MRSTARADAVQKHVENYGKFEAGNKLSLVELQAHLLKDGQVKQADFVEAVLLPRLHELAVQSLEATHKLLNPNRRRYCFELLGYDFMLDSDFNAYLIECNLNPCMELASPYLAELLPAVIESTIQLAVDPVFPGPTKALKPNGFLKIWPREAQAPKPQPQSKEATS